MTNLSKVSSKIVFLMLNIIIKPASLQNNFLSPVPIWLNGFENCYNVLTTNSKTLESSAKRSSQLSVPFTHFNGNFTSIRTHFRQWTVCQSLSIMFDLTQKNIPKQINLEQVIKKLLPSKQCDPRLKNQDQQNLATVADGPLLCCRSTVIFLILPQSNVSYLKTKFAALKLLLEHKYSLFYTYRVTYRKLKPDTSNLHFHRIADEYEDENLYETAFICSQCSNESQKLCVEFPVKCKLRGISTNCRAKMFQVYLNVTGDGKHILRDQFKNNPKSQSSSVKNLLQYYKQLKVGEFKHLISSLIVSGSFFTTDVYTTTGKFPTNSHYIVADIKSYRFLTCYDANSEQQTYFKFLADVIDAKIFVLYVVSLLVTAIIGYIAHDNPNFNINYCTSCCKRTIFSF